MKKSKQKTATRYLFCVRNDDYPASLEVRKIYKTVPDESAKKRHFVRILDESGDDYLYPESYFVAIDLPKIAAAVFAKAS